MMLKVCLIVFLRIKAQIQEASGRLNAWTDDSKTQIIL